MPSSGIPFFFFNDTATTEIYTLSLHDALPISMTHPARSGNVETVTLRYFESMAAKCLIVGHCPAELIEVMGYNPVIEADLSSGPAAAAAQIADILADVGRYQPQVDRNF